MKRPNVLVLFTDQLRRDCMGCAGHPVVRTPNIDKLAEEGVRFTKAYTTAPICIPARCSLVSGMYPHNTKVWQGGAVVYPPKEGCREEKLDPGIDSYVRNLKQAGYRTAHIGKSHYFPQENSDITKDDEYMHQLGFDDVIETHGTWGSVGGISPYMDYLKKHGLADVFNNYYMALSSKPDIVRRFTAEPSPLPEEHVIDSFVGRTAVEYINSYDKEQPSFMFVSFPGPHEPWDPPGKYAAMYDPDKFGDPIPELQQGDWLSDESRKYQRYAQYFQPEKEEQLNRIKAGYFGKISLIDYWIGEIIKACDDKGWLEDTIVILTSDHGEMLGDLGRLSKSVFYEGAAGIPMIISVPGMETKGTECSALVELHDLYNTILELAGIDVNWFVNSRSLVPVLNDSSSKIRDLILSECQIHTMLRDQRYKYVVDKAGNGLQLFDLENDPNEQVNLAGHPDHKEKERRMRDILLVKILSSLYYGGNMPAEFSGHVSIKNVLDYHKKMSPITYR